MQYHLLMVVLSEYSCSYSPFCLSSRPPTLSPRDLHPERENQLDLAEAY